jgi:hydrophobe/amphiphile efflux-3 (HAE3) family protein
MKRPALAVASLVRDHAVAMVAIAMCAAAVLAVGIPRLQFKTGQDSLLSSTDKLSLDNTRFQSHFGGDPLLVLFTMTGGQDVTALFTPENRATMQRLQDDLNASGDYQSVLSPLLIVQFATDQVRQQMLARPQKLAADEQAAADAARQASAARGETPAQQDAAAQAATQKVADAFNAANGADAKRFVDAGEQSLNNPDYVRFILYDADGKPRPALAGIFPDPHHALMVVRMKGNVTLDAASTAAGNVKDRMPRYQFRDTTVLVAGPPLLIKEINDKMKSALAVMAVFAVIIMVLVLSLVFRARWRLLSLPAVLVGCVSAFGLMGFIGIPLTMVTISGLPILLGLGVDFAIQVHSRIEEETFASDSAVIGLDRAFVRLGPALLVAAAAACIGFLVLRLSSVPLIRDFGSMLAVGAAIVFIVSIVLVSGVVYLREHTRIGEAEAVRARFEVERIVGGITARTVGRIAPIALVALVVAVGGLFVNRNIPTQTDPEKFVPSDSAVLKDLHVMRDVAGTTNELNLLVETSGGIKVTDQAFLDWMAAFENRQRAQHEELRTSNSVASFTTSVTGAPPTTADVQQVLSTSPRPLVDMVVAADGTTANITFAISDRATLAQQRDITAAILRDAHPPAGVTVAPAGISVIGIAAMDALSANRDLMSFVALTAIFLTLLAVFRNPVKALAPLFPVVLALGASAMLLYAVGIEYSPLTSISGPLIIAMGTEFNVLLMSRYFEERAAGVAPREAMAKASLRIGRAIMASGLTVMGGFAVLGLSQFPLLESFGKVTALNIGVSLLSTLVLLPPLLVWADEDHHFLNVPADAIAE